MLRRLIFRISALTLCLSAPPAASAAFWDDPQPLGPDEVFALKPGGVVRETIAAAQSENLLVVDLGDGWVPYLFSESDGPADEVKPNPYRETFLSLANDRTSPDEIFLESRPKDPGGPRADQKKPERFRSPRIGLLRRSQGPAIGNAAS